MKEEELWIQLWDLLREGVGQRRSEFHLASAANGSAKGATVRTVVLRYADEATATVGYHTDARASRISDLIAFPQGQIMLYSPTRNVQIRLSGLYRVHVGDQVATDAWVRTPPYSRKCYMSKVASSEVITDDQAPDFGNPSLAESEAGFPNFAVVRLKVDEIEHLNLMAEGHRRYRWTLVEGHWVVARLSP